MSDDGTAPTPSAPANTGSTEAPEWIVKELSGVRSEAAARRVEAREASDKLGEAQTQLQALTTEKEEAATKASTAEQNLLKLKVAIQAGVPGDQAADFAELLQGSTEDELKVYAGKLRSFGGSNQPPRATDPSAGHGAGTPVSDLSPGGQFIKNALKGLGH